MAAEEPQNDGLSPKLARESKNAHRALRDLLKADREATDELVGVAVFLGLFHLNIRIEQMQEEGFDHIGLPELLALIKDTVANLDVDGILD